MSYTAAAAQPPTTHPSTVAASNPNQQIILHGKIDKVLEVFAKLNEEIAIFSQKVAFQSATFKVRVSNCPPKQLFPNWGNESMELKTIRDKVDQNVKILRQRIATVQRKFEKSERAWKLIEGRWASEVTGWYPSNQPVGIDQRMRHVLLTLTLRNPATKKQMSLYDYVAAIPQALTSIPKVLPHYVSTIPVVGSWWYPEPPKRNPKNGIPPSPKPLDQLIPLDGDFFAQLDANIVDLCLLKDEVEIESLDLNPLLDKEIALQIYVRANKRLNQIVEAYKKFTETVTSIEEDQKTSGTLIGQYAKPTYKPVVAETVKEKWKLLTSTQEAIEKLLSVIKVKFTIQSMEETTCKLQAESELHKELDKVQLKVVIDLWGKVMTDMRFKDVDALDSYLEHYYKIKQEWQEKIKQPRAVKEIELTHLKSISRDIDGTLKILEAAAKAVENAIAQAGKNLSENDVAAATPLGIVAKPVVTDDFKTLDNMMG